MINNIEFKPKSISEAFSWHYFAKNYYPFCGALRKNILNVSRDRIKEIFKAKRRGKLFYRVCFIGDGEDCIWVDSIPLELNRFVRKSDLSFNEKFVKIWKNFLSYFPNATTLYIVLLYLIITAISALHNVSRSLINSNLIASVSCDTNCLNNLMEVNFSFLIIFMPICLAVIFPLIYFFYKKRKCSVVLYRALSVECLMILMLGLTIGYKSIGYGVFQKLNELQQLNEQKGVSFVVVLKKTISRSIAGE